MALEAIEDQPFKNQSFNENSDVYKELFNYSGEWRPGVDPIVGLTSWWVGSIPEASVAAALTRGDVTAIIAFIKQCQSYI